MQNHIVRRLDARTNHIETIAGCGKPGFSGDGGPATAATMDKPHSIQFDLSGENLYICDIGNHRIRRVTLVSGVISTWCGNGKAGATPDGAPVGPETPLRGPRALDIAPNGDFWLALREGNQVFRIDSRAGKIYQVAGTGRKDFSRGISRRGSRSYLVRKGARSHPMERQSISPIPSRIRCGRLI